MNAPVKPLVREHEPERGGEHVRFMAGVRSRIAKQGGDATGDLAGADLDKAPRLPAPASMAEIVTGGELAPLNSEFRDTVTNPDFVTVDASKDRMDLAHSAGALELALDAADSINAKNSLEKMMAHQLATVHREMMKMSALLEDMQHLSPSVMGYAQKNVERCRLAGTVAKMATAYQTGFLALHRTRSGGRQHVTVRHTVQHVHVNEGGQAVVAGKIGGTGGAIAKPRRGSAQK